LSRLQPFNDGAQ